MNILPAIDIKDGQCVRLYQGDFTKQTVVNPDPLKQAAVFQQAGMTHLHIVDLDGALTGEAVNADLIKQIKRQTSSFIQVGGGIRTMTQIDDYLSAGIDRVIIGSAALSRPELVKEAVAKYGKQIAVGIDAKNGQVAVDGWLNVSETDFLTLALAMQKAGVSTLIYTDIAKDGTLTGPTLPHYQQLLDELNIAVIASGGVRNKADLTALAKLGLSGAIVGKAYYSGQITLEEMKEVSADAG